MCQTCYDRGYQDYPFFVGSSEHQEDYNKGFNDKKNESDGDPEELYETDFCHKCYDRGLHDFANDIETPPTKDVRGHYESYMAGYNCKEKERKEEKENEEISVIQQSYRNRNDEDIQYRPKPKSRNSDPYFTSDDTWETIVGKILGAILIIWAAIWLAQNVLLPLLIINIATIALIFGLVKKAWRSTLYIISFLGTIVIILDYNYGWQTRELPANVSFFARTIPFFFYLNLTAGLVAVYFLIQNLLNRKNPPSQGKSRFSKENIITIVSLVVVGAGTIIIQNYVGLRELFGNNSNIVAYTENDPAAVQPNNNVYNADVDGRQAGQEYLNCNEKLWSDLIQIDKGFIETFNPVNFRTQDDANNLKNELENAAYNANKECRDNAEKNKNQMMRSQDANGSIVYKYTEQDLKKFYAAYEEAITIKSENHDKFDSIALVVRTLIASLPASPPMSDTSIASRQPIENATSTESTPTATVSDNGL
jgi:hypothetical protein